MKTMTKKESSLPKTYHRVLQVAAQHIETAMDEIIELMRQSGKQSITRKVSPSFSTESRKQFIHVAETMKGKLAEFVDYFHLEKNHVREDRIMRAKVALLWEMLQDTKSDKLIGYGQIPQPLQKEIDQWVSEFLRLLRNLET
jgi:hypothetical protein